MESSRSDRQNVHELLYRRETLDQLEDSGKSLADVARGKVN
jgi:hypothetical protein